MIIRDIYELSRSGKKSIHKLIEESINTYPTEVDETWREYAIGKVKDRVGSKRKAAVGTTNLTSPQQNMIRMCIKQIVGRLRFKGFVVDDTTTQEFLNTYAIKNDFTRLAVGVGRRALVDGNTALSQYWREGSSAGVPFVRQEYWRNEEESGIFVAVDDNHTPVWAVSDYHDNDDVEHRIIWLPDRILSYIKGEVGADPDGWKLIEESPWLTKDGKPIGMAVTHFPNAEQDYGPYGSSTVGEIVTVQDSLNLNLFNRMAVSALTGQQIVWGTGVKKIEIPDSVGPGMFLTADGEGSRFGFIPAGSIDGLLHETDDLRGIISGAFPVPSYRLGAGDWPSGLALQRSDGPMLTAIRLLRDMITPALVHHAHRATIMSNTFGNTSLDTESLITVDWENLDDLDPSTEAEILQMRVEALMGAESLSEHSLKKLGVFTPEEIEDIVKAREEREEEAELVAQAETEDKDF